MADGGEKRPTKGIEAALEQAELVEALEETELSELDDIDLQQDLKVIT